MNMLSRYACPAALAFITLLAGWAAAQAAEETRTRADRYSSGLATRNPTTLSREPLGKFMREAGLANSAS